MSEGLIKRIGRLVSGSANALIDSIENAAPQIVMEEAIREIDEAIKEVREQLGKVEASKYLSSKTLNADSAKHDELQVQINDAINAGRDDLAEAAIAKQMDIEAKLPVVEKAIIDADSEITELGSYVDALQAKKREMEATLQEFIKASEHQSNGSTDAPSSKGVSDKVEGAESAFNRMLSNVGVPTGSSTADEAKLAELEKLSRSNRIKERLAKAKSSVSS